MKTRLNACKITWSVIELNSKLTKKLKKQLERIGCSIMSESVILRHYPNKEKAVEAATSIIQTLTYNNKGGRITFITDKQYGMTLNSWNGVAKANNYTSHNIIAKSGNMVSNIPVTKMQVDNAIKF